MDTTAEKCHAVGPVKATEYALWLLIYIFLSYGCCLLLLSN